ncbi:MAG: glutamate--cysteine ligase [Tissierellia bacterium]|nr:glutamate--cysteine ligase [Tissierellia bacterium]
MDYQKQIKEISGYIRSGEKSKDDLKIGVEFEHIIIDKESLRSISYYGKNGLAETLKELEPNGWKGIYEGENILGLMKDNMNITLEPGSQFEVSIMKEEKIEDLEKIYLEFLNEVIPVLEAKGQGLMALGYHPVTKIEEIRLLPKKRYDFMFNHFKSAGSHGHNMMKGTAALQVSVDYMNEDDYKKKFRVINALSPVMYALFENARYFEGETRDEHTIRAFIWENTDRDRSGIIPGVLDKDFGYESYAEYVLNRPPILEMVNGIAKSTGDKKVRDLLDPDNYKIEDLEHFLTMFFPDVRTKKYMEIRMMDSIPYPLNFSVVALWKGLLYNNDSLEEIYTLTKDISDFEANKAKEEMIEKGFMAKIKDKTLLDIGKTVVQIAKKGLDDKEVSYILPLERMLDEGKNPYLITKENEYKGKKEALRWCMLNDII